MNKTFFPILALILMACSSAPQVIVAPEATPTSTTPPTETPLPTLTPTPVAVDGIAENAEGDKLAFLNGEWTMLPELDADYASMRVDENGDVVAVDAKGEVVYELDASAWQWKEVVREPKKYLLGHNEAIRKAMDNMQIGNYRELKYNDVDGSDVPMGYLGPSGNGGALFSGVLLKVVNLKDYDPRFKDEVRGVVLGMVLPDNTEIKILLRVSTNPPKLMREPVDPNVWTDTEAGQYKEGIYAVRDEVKIAEFLKQAEGEQVLFTMNYGGDNSPALKEIMRIVEGEDPNLTVFEGLDYVQLGIIWMMDPALGD